MQRDFGMLDVDAIGQVQQLLTYLFAASPQLLGQARPSVAPTEAYAALLLNQAQYLQSGQSFHLSLHVCAAPHITLRRWQ